MLNKISELAKTNKKISDFHLRSGSDISYRALGDIVMEPNSQVEDKDLQELLKSNCSEIEIKKFLPALLKGRNAVVSKTDAEGCAEWVNSQTGSTFGNAWHMHNLAAKSSFDNLDDSIKQKLASIFSKIISSFLDSSTML